MRNIEYIRRIQYLTNQVATLEVQYIERTRALDDMADDEYTPHEEYMRRLHEVNTLKARITRVMNALDRARERGGDM